MVTAMSNEADTSFPLCTYPLNIFRIHPKARIAPRRHPSRLPMHQNSVNPHLWDFQFSGFMHHMGRRWVPRDAPINTSLHAQPYTDPPTEPTFQPRKGIISGAPELGKHHFPYLLGRSGPVRVKPQRGEPKSSTKRPRSTSITPLSNPEILPRNIVYRFCEDGLG